MVTLGAGAYTYEVTENWASLPDGWSFKEVAAVAVDAYDNVYAFNRGEHPHDGFRPRRQLFAVLGRRALSPRPWPDSRPGRYPILHGRW